MRLSASFHLPLTAPRSHPHTGIKRLEMLPPGQDGRKCWESVGITSPDGEWAGGGEGSSKGAAMCLAR